MTIDTTTSNVLEEADSPQAEQQSGADPVMAITIALANTLQRIYADKPAKLDAANKVLRRATRPHQS